LVNQRRRFAASTEEIVEARSERVESLGTRRGYTVELTAGVFRHG
jgi:hypothetical protein